MLSIAAAATAAWLCSCSSDFPLDCVYVAAEPQADIEPHSDCAALIDQKPRISPAHLHRMSFDRNGLAAAFVDTSWYYMKPGGESLAVITYDNFADEFSEGLVRSLVDGKIAYYDASFAEVIPPKYDWAWPFENGRALVCRECSLDPPDLDGHRAVVGGLWGYIDHEGNEVVPVTLSRKEAFHLEPPR